jgi:hypothetical protein
VRDLAGRLRLPEGYECQTEQAGAEQEQAARLGRHYVDIIDVNSATVHGDIKGTDGGVAESAG